MEPDSLVVVLWLVSSLVTDVVDAAGSLTVLDGMFSVSVCRLPEGGDPGGSANTLRQQIHVFSCVGLLSHRF